jgi:hypothetical protein
VGQKCNKPSVKRKVIHDSSSVGEKIYKCSVKSNLILITSYMGGKSLKCSMKRNMILGNGLLYALQRAYYTSGPHSL